LPAFLLEPYPEGASDDDILAGFALTGFFLMRHVLDPRGLKLADARTSFIAAIRRAP